MGRFRQHSVVKRVAVLLLLLSICLSFIFLVFFATTETPSFDMFQQYDFQESQENVDGNNKNFPFEENEAKRWDQGFYKDSENNYYDLSEENVVIGLVNCGAGPSRSLYNNLTIVLMKSVLISAQIYQVPNIEFHQFLEFQEDEELFRDTLKNMGYSSKNDNDGAMTSPTVKVRLHTYALMDVRIPKRFEKTMIYHPRFRCGYIRYYFPSALPENLESIIYLDSDNIVTGNVMDLWMHFSKMKQHNKMVGAVNLREPENDRFPETRGWDIGKIPHLTRYGLASGVLFMNLTKMREYGWEERITRVHQDYSEIRGGITDMQVFNVLAYYNPELVLLLPCNFGFGPTSCKRGLYCNAALKDPLGVQLVQTFNHSYVSHDVFYGLFKYFWDFEFAGNQSVEFIKRNLMEPIRKWYDTETDGTAQCKGLLTPLLFPNFFDHINENM